MSRSNKIISCRTIVIPLVCFLILAGAAVLVAWQSGVIQFTEEDSRLSENVINRLTPGTLEHLEYQLDHAVLDPFELKVNGTETKIIINSMDSSPSYFEELISRAMIAICQSRYQDFETISLIVIRPNTTNSEHSEKQITARAVFSHSTIDKICRDPYSKRKLIQLANEFSTQNDGSD
ncbi:hypothetical protein F1728_29275 [Gimesia benthica]|uniref:Uncharacterized protein n=1 Tax=Gimesia benthica TaxID=2608982 RepID=A0A6I6AQC0_9PLAN|nr:hypothetical protein [Gimesia benthica]QGQ26519.1 hypothetical protein F1728_29275 [Gimesia benthica]